jgi:hypothetical protein
MKKLIFLKLEYGKKADGPLAEFRAAIKQWDYIKIIKELAPKPKVVIEYPDAKHDEVYDNLRQLDIVDIIDSILPAGL